MELLSLSNNTINVKTVIKEIADNIKAMLLAECTKLINDQRLSHQGFHLEVLNGITYMLQGSYRRAIATCNAVGILLQSRIPKKPILDPELKF
ncbi:hypothetical protein BY996DRAFT_6574999 [Phakopsora pachyrhizi]|nr:hypothetical protein BY996DRAFT_6574999 [Phakopsora pachyrhizi]